MTVYTRKQVMQILSVDEGFLLSLEEEGIVISDQGSEYTERMLERVRVAQNLTRHLDVNLAGVAVILRMREEMAEMRRRIEDLVAEIRGRS